MFYFKKRILRVILIVVLFLPIISYSNQDVPESIKTKVEDLLQKMTIEEKASQMSQSKDFRQLTEYTDSELRRLVEERIKDGTGDIRFPGKEFDPEKAAIFCNKLQKYVIETNRLGIPSMFDAECNTGIGGKGNTEFPMPITIASSWDLELVKRVYSAIGLEARARGFNIVLSPLGDIARDPRFGRMHQTYGEDSYLVSEMLTSAVKGLQGEDYLIDKEHVGAVCKHFAGYAQLSGGRNFAAVQISPRVFADEILLPFRKVIKEAKNIGIMPCHPAINGIPTHGNKHLLTDILRKELDFKGFTFKDANDIQRLHFFMQVAETPEEAAIMALKAGVNIDSRREDTGGGYRLLPQIIKEHPELEENIDQAVRNILTAKFRLGLFDDPFIDPERAKEVIRSEEHLDLAREIAENSIILLKNKDNTLPLNKKKLKKIAVIGPRSEEQILSGIKDYVGEGAQVSHEKGCDIINESGESEDESIQRAADLAEDSDVAIVCIGGNSRTAKETGFAENGPRGDRYSIDLAGRQNDLFNSVVETGTPTVVVLLHRRTLSVVDVARKADAILDGWYLGEKGGVAVSRVLFGEVNPSGKLPVTVPYSIGQIPFHYCLNQTSVHKGYLFSEDTPFKYGNMNILYPFGYGLSYTDFEYSNLRLSSSEMPMDGEIKVKVDVKNTGSMSGKEVVQMYLRDDYASVTRPLKLLKGFKKISFNPGEIKTVTFTIQPEMLYFTGREMKRIIEPGKFTVMVGASSLNHLKTKFELVE